MKTQQSVWLILDSRNFGGIETHVLELAKGLSKYKIPVEIIFLTNYGQHPITSQLQQHRICFRVLEHGLFSLINAQMREKPILLHSHGYKAGIYGRVAALLTSCTLVSSFHSAETLSGKLALYDFVDRFSSSFSHALIAVSAQINARLGNQCTVIDNFVGIEHQGFPGQQIAFVGRLSHEKGPDEFLKLASFFGQRLFHIYGDGPMRHSLEQQAGDNVVFHGHQSSMALQWQHIGLLVMPSRQEGLPMAALEAMAHGIPVCAYRVGSLERLINSRNGWLAEPGDFNSLHHAISQWLSSSSKRNLARSRHARKSILSKFSDVIAVPIFIDCYNKALISNKQAHQQLLSHNKEPSHGVD